LTLAAVVLSQRLGAMNRASWRLEKFGLDYAEVNALHTFIFNVYEIGGVTLG
jgi:putative hydrolase of the HAD superfamily